MRRPAGRGSAARRSREPAPAPRERDEVPTADRFREVLDIYAPGLRALVG